MACTLVTGGAGFVGLALVEHLLGRGEQVVVFDVLDVPPDAREAFAALPGRLETVRASVLDGRAVQDAVQRTRPDALVHAATVTPSAAHEKIDAVTVNEANYNGTLEVLKAVRATGVRLVHLSTSGVYGAIQDRPGFAAETIGEDVLPDPRTLYAISKTAAEQTVLRYADLFGLDAIVARVGVTWGPWEYDTGLRHVFSAPLQLLRVAAAGGEAVIARESVKDWSYSRDVAQAIALLKDARASLRSRVFNVGADTPWPVSRIAQRLAGEFTGFRWRIAASPDDPSVNVSLSKASDRQPLDVTRLKTETGYRPRFTMDAAVADYAAWARRSVCWR